MTKPPPPAGKLESLQQTIRRMQTQYVSTGGFRVEDVRRVLGDPKDGVVVQVPDGYTPNENRKPPK